ncbi:hypothetical protein LTR41_010970 [Exophiala xenobiotica]|nr:hypothetical protein LTR41_010970 [Exophiala xenobiotica]KAK5551138.1 hypothetical protein LTR46_010891 [Exophiala xenobiotica]
MVKYPSVLKKAQAEVDKVIRWRPVAAGGIPHTLIQDDIWQDYHFPKGTMFIANTWAIYHDPACYDAPDEFRPERYEHNEPGRKQHYEPLDGVRTTYGFGAGRRICPGLHLAENSLIINMSKLVWVFDIGPGTDVDTGRQLLKEEINDFVETAWTDGFLTAPKPFPVTLRVRSPAHKAVIDKECREAQDTIFREYD